MIRTGLGVLALTAVAIAAAGCGGSKGLSRAELIAKADPICKRANNALDSSKINPGNLVTVAPAVAIAERQASAKLAKLTPPASLASDWKVIVDGFHRASVGLEEVGSAAKAGSQAGPTKAFVEGETEMNKGQENRATTASRDGFIDCAKF